MSDKTVEQATESLITLVQEARMIESKLLELKTESDKLTERLSELSSPWHHNLIRRARAELERAKRLEDDANRRKVVWVKEECNNEFVVVKVTPKRIYVRRRGSETQDYYSKDGTRHSFGRAIDIDKTFPEGIDNYVQDN